MLDTLLVLIVVYFVGRALYAIFRIVQEIYLLKELNLAERYGRGSFAVVTGSTDGIGLEFAVQLAKRGFNIVMVSRNAQKMAEKEQLIKAANANVQVIKIEFDFTQSCSVEKLEAIAEMLKDVDVSIVVNNVGIMSNGTPLLELDMQYAMDMIVVNCVSQTVLDRLFIPRLKARAHKSAVIDMSSISCMFYVPGREIYPATKSYNRSFNNAISIKAESDNIDFLAVKPGYVSTPLTANRPIDWMTCNTEECVNGSLKALGHKLETFGATKHVLLGPAFEFILTIVPLEFALKHKKRIFGLFKSKTLTNAEVAK